MIVGQVTADSEATIALELQSADRRMIEITAVVDTGYDGWLTLPSTLIDNLGWPWQRLGWAILADESEIMFDVHEGCIAWDGKLRQIPVDCTGGMPLVGMSLLKGYRLTLDVIVDGAVRIEKLTNSSQN